MENSQKPKKSKFQKRIKQRIYQWHRIIGILTIIPLVFWTFSGLMHPFMAHFFKPSIAHEQLESKIIDKSQLKLSIQEVLEKNKIESFKNFRIVSFNNQSFYQIKTLQDKLLYFDTNQGKLLENGDEKYAHWLSRYFLDDQKSLIQKTEILTKFNSEYKYINRYLPVYKTSFDRNDKMEVYVETASGKLATFNPASRQAFIWFFDNFHNWSFIDAISNNYLRISIMILFLGIIFFSALSGILIYGFFWKQFRKADSLNPKKGLRKYHRQIGVWVSIFALAFAFSGAYHATTKWKPYVLDKMVYEPTILTKNIAIPNNKLQLDWSRFENARLILYKNQLFYQVSLALPKVKNEFGKEKSVSETAYINAKTNQITPNLDLEYAKFLAFYFSNFQTEMSCCEEDYQCPCPRDLENSRLLETKVLTAFNNREYGFVNKRLPVVKLDFDTPEKTSFFVETSTSRISAIIENADRNEGYSFALLHKFLFMDWAGKTIRDLFTVLVALTILIVGILGLVLFFRKS